VDGTESFPSETRQRGWRTAAPDLDVAGDSHFRFGHENLIKFPFLAVKQSEVTANNAKQPSMIFNHFHVHKTSLENSKTRKSLNSRFELGGESEKLSQNVYRLCRRISNFTRQKSILERRENFSCS
jgi:hypothetical protein